MKTRVKEVVFSDIVKFTKSQLLEIRASKKRAGHGASAMVRSLCKDEGFFIVSEEKKAWTHLYKAAIDSGFSVEVLRSTNENGDTGYYVIRN